jgi:charged multivesicular body protein 2A
MGDAMKGVTKALGAMNKRMNLPEIQKIMREFEKQNETMEMTSETMGDAIDDAIEVSIHLLLSKSSITWGLSK